MKDYTNEKKFARCFIDTPMNKLRGFSLHSNVPLEVGLTVAPRAFYRLGMPYRDAKKYASHVSQQVSFYE